MSIDVLSGSQSVQTCVTEDSAHAVTSEAVYVSDVLSKQGVLGPTQWGVQERFQAGKPLLCHEWPELTSGLNIR